MHRMNQQMSSPFCSLKIHLFTYFYVSVCLCEFISTMHMERTLEDRGH